MVLKHQCFSQNNELIFVSENECGIDDRQLKELIEQSIAMHSNLKKVLVVPPDFTRAYSKAGEITRMYFEILKNRCEVDIIPALGTHEPMTAQECREFFGEEIPYDKIIHHDWRKDVVKIGTVPSKFIYEVSEGIMSDDIDVEVNKILLDKTYDLIISVGQVVPHEVVGMANYNKNIFVGLGGSRMISYSHMLGAFYGMERIMGKDHSPVRKVFDYAQNHFLYNVPIMYVLTVTTNKDGKVLLHGFFAGKERKIFEEAVRLSQKKNIIFLDKAPKKVVAFLDPKEFKSTWLGNKAVYRTRMAIADQGELLVIAPSVAKFGEDEEIDKLIRKYGYKGRQYILDAVKHNKDLQENLSAAAHLIHGSSDGRFKITYAAGKLTQEEVISVGYNYIKFEEAVKRYNPEKLNEGFNIMEDGEEIYFVKNPALGLWIYKGMFC